MEGYDNASYGEAFADVYDDWYGDITDAGPAVDALASRALLSAPGPVVELGIGTGRIAVPLAERLQPLPVWGIDSSQAMLARIQFKCPPPNLHVVCGDMVDELRSVCPGAGLGLVFVAFNTFFNLASSTLQQECLQVVAERLAANGCVVIEAFVPDEPARAGDRIEVKSLDVARVVLSVIRYTGEQRVEGQFVEFTEAGGVRLRPWSIRYASPAELDAMAAAAGLQLRDRWESFSGDDFTPDSARHVSVYGLAQD